jgi:hypothetical protein
LGLTRRGSFSAARDLLMAALIAKSRLKSLGGALVAEALAGLLTGLVAPKNLPVVPSPPYRCHA